jgi:hypothetical protein
LRHLCNIGCDFRHYITDFAGALGQAQSEARQKLSGGRFWRGNYPQTQFVADQMMSGC